MKKRGLLLLIGIVIVSLGGLGIRLLTQPRPTELVAHGLERLNRATSFRYTVTQQQWVEGKERVLTQIQGEKDGENTRIWGQLVGTDVEMVKVKDSIYNRDPFVKRWVKFAGSLSTQEVFLAELDPLASLQFKEIGEVVLLGNEKVNGEKTYVCAIKPSVQNQIMAEFWTDFTYRLFVRKTDTTVVKAEIQAKSKAKGEPMTMILEFKDIGQKISVQAPNI